MKPKLKHYILLVLLLFLIFVVFRTGILKPSMKLIWQHNQSKSELIALAQNSPVVAIARGSEISLIEAPELKWKLDYGKNIRLISLSPSGEKIAIAADNGLSLINKDKKILWKKELKNIKPEEIKLGESLMIIKDNRSIYLLSTKNSKVIKELEFELKPKIIEISEDEKHFAVVEEKGKDVFIDPEKRRGFLGVEFKSFLNIFDSQGNLIFRKEINDWITDIDLGKSLIAVAISMDDNYIAAGSRSGKVYFFDKTGRVLWKYKIGGWGNFIRAVSISEKEKYIAAFNGSNLYLLSKDRNLVSTHNFDKRIEIPNLLSVSERYLILATKTHVRVFAIQPRW